MVVSIFLYVLLAITILVILFSDYGSIPRSQRFETITSAPLMKMKDEHREILIKYFPYFAGLTVPERIFFEKRLIEFINSKKFLPRQMAEVTLEMKTFIAASAVQLTFGLPMVYLSHFKYILVYPDEYYSQITKKYHKGEVNPRHQAIVLSWKAFIEGYFKQEGVNLGLHEMAHALHLENTIRNEEFDFLPEKELKVWDQLAGGEMEKIKSGAECFFREYGATNAYEFFAVAVESFFERPQQFKEYNEELFLVLAKILNQNPTMQRE